MAVLLFCVLLAVVIGSNYRAVVTLGSTHPDDVRAVPAKTALALRVGGWQVQFGAFFFAFGMLAWWAFGAQADVTSWFRFSGELRRVEGTVIACEATSLSEGSGDASAPVFRIGYRFEPGTGVEFRGVAYATGGQYRYGTKVPVEYLPGDPDVSRIAGTRKRPVGLDGFFLGLIFPAAGAGVLLAGLRKNAAALRVLRRGKFARGRLILKQPTSSKFNGHTVHEFTFEYRTEHGIARQIVTQTHHAGLLEDEATKRLFYDPTKASDGVLIDLLPGLPTVTEDGQIGEPTRGAVVWLITPVLVVVSLVLGFVIHLSFPL